MDPDIIYAGDFEDVGNQSSYLEDNDEVVLFRSLEHELESLVQRYRVPPDELQQLFEVVQKMFDLMDCNRDAFEKMELEKNELDDLWKKEKDNLRKTQMRKLELESQLEEEKMKIEHDKMNIEKEKVVLETKVKHIGEQKQYIEQELQQLKEKASRDEQTRQELLEQYKKQTDSVRTASLQRRMQSPLLPRRRALPIAPERRRPLAYSLSVPGHNPLEDSTRSARLGIPGQNADSFMIGSMEVSREDIGRRRVQDEMEVKEAEKRKKSRRDRAMSPPCILSLDDEFKQLDGGGEGEGEGERDVSEETLLEDVIIEESYEEEQQQGEAAEGEEDEGEGENWNFEEEIRLQEDMMAVKMEVEMMQKEKESWEEEKKNLELGKTDAISQREALERKNAELQVELRRLKEAQDGMKDRIEEVTKERDEIFDNYLEQPFSEYCITRKELHDLLMRQQTTAIELQEEKEQRMRLQKLLESKRSFLERFRERMKKLFTRDQRGHQQATPSKKEVELAPRQAAPYPSVPSPLYRSLALLLDQGYLEVERGWLMSADTNLKVEQLPHWMGQITLKGVVTDRIECVELGQIYYSPLELYSSQMTPPRQRKIKPNKRERMILTGLHAEVWVATKEDSVACIEVVDVLARPPKVRQRFTLKPKTPHIVCMRSIPGIIEQSRDFANSSVHTHKTDWVSASLFTGSASSSSPSYLVQRRFSDSRQRLRPKSASFTASRENGGFLLASTPDLSSMSGYSEAAVPVDIDLFSSTSPESPLTPARNRKSLRRTGSDSPTTMLKTINEVPLASASDSAIKRDESSGDDPLQSEEGSSSSLRSGESEIEMTDGLFSFGKRNNRKTPQSGGLQNGNRSPGIGTENVMTSTPRDPKTKSKLEFTHSPPPPKKNDSLTRSAEWMHFSEPAGTYASGKLRDKFPDYSQGPIPEVSITNEESQDGKTGERKYTDGKSPVMWIITEDNTLYFYPTTDPSHRPINHVQLRSRATCIEYICGKVFVGHIASAVSVYHKDEFSPSWDIENPEIITLPSFNPEVQNDVRCIAAVKDRVWVGAGPSIFFLSAENLQREGSRFLNSWHYPPDHILPLGEVVAVSTKGSSLFIFDAESANILRKFDVYPMTKQLEIVEENSKWRDPKKASKWNDRSVIKTMVADENNMLYVGTSSGMVVAIPIDSLKKGVPVTNGHVTNGFEDTDAAREEILKRELKLAVTSESFKGEKKSEESASEETDSGGGSRNSSGLLDEPESVYLDNCALALHIQKDSRVRSLLHLKLPLKPPSNLNSPSPSETGALYHSLPNLNSSFGSRMSISPPILSYRSLIISAGKGHMEYSEDPEPEDNGVLPTNYNALRERNEAYQLLVWGHRNAAKYQYN